MWNSWSHTKSRRDRPNCHSRGLSEARYSIDCYGCDEWLDCQRKIQCAISCRGDVLIISVVHARPDSRLNNDGQTNKEYNLIKVHNKKWPLKHFSLYSYMKMRTLWAKLLPACSLAMWGWSSEVQNIFFVKGLIWRFRIGTLTGEFPAVVSLNWHYKELFLIHNLYVLICWFKMPEIFICM